MKFCRFEIADGMARCLDCGYEMRTAQTKQRKVFRSGCKGAKPAPLAEEEFAVIPCIHRGPELRRMEGTLCGMRGEMFPVHQCSVHGECTLTRICPKSTIKAVCATCEKRA